MRGVHTLEKTHTHTGTLTSHPPELLPSPRLEKTRPQLPHHTLALFWGAVMLPDSARRSWRLWGANAQGSG